MFSGYAEASEQDEQISALIEEHGITAATRREWMTYIRTLQTSLDLINAAINALPKVCPQCDGTGKVR